MIFRSIKGITPGLLITLLASPEAYGQGCAMCRTAVAQLENAAQALNLGILILLIPPMVIMSAILFTAFWRE